MTTLENPLNLTRGQIAKFCPDQRTIIAIEQLFKRANIEIPTTVNTILQEAAIQAGAAENKAIEALDALARIANSVELAALAPPIPPAITPAHNDLPGIQGGTSGQYYHMTLSEDAELAALDALSPGVVEKTADATYSAVARGNLTEATSSVLTITGGTSATLGNVSVEVKAAATGQSGYLTSTDWNTFNGKQAGDADLTAIAGLSGTGLAERTGTDTWALSTKGAGIPGGHLTKSSLLWSPYRTGDGGGYSTYYTSNAVYQPVFFPIAFTISSLGVKVQSANASGAVKIGFYADDGTVYPGALLIDSGEITLGSTGEQMSTVGCPYTGAPGLYWLILYSNASSTSLYGLNSKQIITPSAGSQSYGFLAKAYTYPTGAVPDPAPASAALDDRVGFAGFKLS